MPQHNTKPSMHTKRRRGTVIVETANGILLTRMRHDDYLLPGGQAERGEPRIVTAIRELKEETGLIAEDVRYLFDFESRFYQHKVFYIRASGTARPSQEVEELAYYQPQMRGLADSSRRIIERYLKEHKVCE